MEPIWVMMPWRNNPTMTLEAVEDCLAQTVPTRVLLIDQGASHEDREQVDQWIDQRDDHRVLCWHYLPMLPSLSAVWNRALRFVWELGGSEALVVNNDCRLARGTVECLSRVLGMEQALFVSAVGVREADWPTVPPQDDPYMWSSAFHDGPAYNKGGPDFSCFLISRAGHEKYPFDEHFIPAFREDLDCHRRYMLGGDGGKIFSVNVPYLHYASGTLKAYSPEERARFNRASVANREYYTRKWGGDVNEEKWVSPFGVDEPPDGAAYTATPDLQARYSAGLRPCGDTQLVPGEGATQHTDSLARIVEAPDGIASGP